MIPNRDKEREKLMLLYLKDTEKEIIEIDITIQKLKDCKGMDLSINQVIEKPIKELITQKEYLKDIYENEKQTLFLNMTDEDRHKAINNKICAICGNKLNWNCYAEDSFSIECVNCEILYAEN